jgi:flagellar protein FlaI
VDDGPGDGLEEPHPADTPSSTPGDDSGGSPEADAPDERPPGPDEAEHREDVREAVLRSVRRWFEERGDEEPRFGDVAPSYLDERFFDFGYLEDRVEIERVWLDEPFAYASICLDPDEDSYSYHVVEPELDDFERHVRADLGDAIRAVVRDRDLDPGEIRERFDDIATDLVRENTRELEPGSVWCVYHHLMRDYAGYGPIDPLLHDPEIEDISCDGAEVPVYVYHARYRDLPTNVVFGSDELDDYTMRLAQRAGKPISVSDPLVHGSLPDGSRIQLTLGSDVATRGSNFTIRKFRDIPFTPVELIANNTFSVEAMAYFWLAIENRKSVLFVGPTASGKTTSMNAVSLFLPPDAKVISIEEMRELAIPHDNWISNVTRETRTEAGRQDVSMYDLLGAALHQRPEYLLVGEMRTDPEIVRTFFQSIFTGHPGASTFHAGSVESAVNRFSSEPLAIEPQLLASLDVIAVQKQVFIQDRRVRRNETVAEIALDDAGDDVEHETVFDWVPSTDSFRSTADLVDESVVLGEIMDERGWDDTRLLQEFYDRQDVLSYLVEHDVQDYDDVVDVLYRFARNRDAVMDRIHDTSAELPSEDRGP